MNNDTKQAQARALLDQLKRQYLAELPNKIEDIEGILLAFDPQADSRDEFDTLYRQVHSLKGSAGTYGLHIISTICHKLEDYLEYSSTTPKDEFLRHALRFIDLLKGVFELLQQGTASFQAIEQALSDLDGSIYKQTSNVLLVTPSKSTQALCIGVLQPLPLHISITEDGITALTRLGCEKFDVLITGMENPTLNGMSLTAALRLSGGANATIKTILLTSDIADHINYSRFTDPDIVIHRNARFADNLLSTVHGFIQP